MTSDPRFIRRDVSGYLPCRQSDRVWSFVLVFVLFQGAFDTGSRAGEGQLRLLRGLSAAPRGSAFSCELCSSTSSFRLFCDQSVRLAHGELSSASSSILGRWISSRAAKESIAAAAAAATAAAAAVLKNIYR